MGRLTALKPRVATLQPRVASHSDEQGHSPVMEPWRRWFGTVRWRDLRDFVLLRDRYTCQCGCGHLEHDTSQLVADHRIPHRGDPALFWDPANLQCLWKPHHDREKQAADRRAILGPTTG